MLDLVLEEEFRLWRIALVEHGHVLPDGRAAAGETSFLPEEATGPVLPVVVQAEHPSADERETGRRSRWPAMIFVGSLVLAISVLGYRNLDVRPTTLNQSAAPRPTEAPPLAHAPAPERAAPLDETDRRRAEQADNITHAGEALALSGDAVEASRLFLQSLAIRRELAGRYPGDATVLRALAGNWDKLADALVAQGDMTRALGAYREADAAWEHRAQLLPEDRDVQRAWSLTALSLGNLQLARNDPAAAVEAFRRGTSLQETLCRLEPENVAWQEDLALAFLRLSDAFDQRGDDQAALGVCRRAVAIDETLVTRDSTNLAWQADLAAARGKTGDLLLARNEIDAALQEYDAAAARWEKLATADASPERRRTLAETQARIGQVMEMKKQPAAALPFYQKALTILAEIPKEHPANEPLESLRAITCFHLGRAMAACQPVDQQAARATLHEARDRLIALRSADGTFPSKELAEALTDVERLLAESDK